MSQVENHLIALLPEKDRERLLALCEPVKLVLADVLCTRGELTRYVYFPTESFISLISQIEGHPGLEVGMVGSEGMLGAQLVVGVATSPLNALVQGSGAAWRIPVAPFRRELATSTALRHVLLHYIYVRLAQLARSAACLRFHQVSPRLARWLLMSQDRAHANRFAVTQEFLAFMLGVRRVGITTAAGKLQHRGLISYHRGDLTIVDRPGLELEACGCYAADRLAYTELMTLPDLALGALVIIPPPST